MRYPLQGGVQTSHVARNIIFYALLKKSASVSYFSFCVFSVILKKLQNLKKKIRKCEVLLCNEMCCGL
jgi:hypothetical protein